MMSNSTCLNGGASLFLTTFTRVVVADDLVAFLDRTGAADVEARPRRRTSSALPPVVVSGDAVHHADLHADLVDEDHAWCWDLLMEAVSLRSAWRHQARLQARQAVAHLAFEFGAGHQAPRPRSITSDVDRAGAHQGVGDLQRLLAGVGLGDQAGRRR